MPLREKMQNLARSMLQNEIEAEDSVQETYLRIWSLRDKLENHPNSQGFAMQTLKNICIDKLRAEKTNLSLEILNLQEGGRDPYSQTEQNDSIRIVKQIMETLPELQRKIMMMRDVDGYELDEIAEIIGSEVTAVRMNLSRARTKVRDRYLNINRMHKEPI